MNVLFDLAGCRRFVFQASQLVGDEERRYYCLAEADDRLAILVTRHGLNLTDLVGLVIDAGLGWDNGRPGFAYHGPQLHTKITAYGRVEARHEATLSEVLGKAPERRRKG